MDLLIGLSLLINAASPSFCSVGMLRKNPDGYFWPLSYVEMFVDSADVIVRAEASSIGPRRTAPQPHHYPDTEIRFKVLEVLKGSSSIMEVMVAGSFVDKDDFNPTEVPYRMVRLAGQRGDCFAIEYKQGAQYLLILQRQAGLLTPYWRPLAPLNEQVHGREDRWVRWVRKRATSTRQR